MAYSKTPLLERSTVGNQEIESCVLRIVDGSSKPVSVAYVAYNAKLSWPTARAILLKLSADGKIEAIETTSGRVFMPSGKRRFTS